MEKQKDQPRPTSRKVMKRNALVTVLVALVLIGSYAMWVKASGPGKYDQFAECLTENDWTMFGTDWCPHCQRQKKMFGKSFASIHYVNCDIGSACSDAGVKSYPTWGKNGKLEASGVKELSTLARLSSCSLTGK